MTLAILLVFIVITLFLMRESGFGVSPADRFAPGARHRLSPQMIHDILKDNTYYKNLSDDARRKFIERVQKYLSIKYFKGMNGVQVSHEMRVKISACLTQLTFGLDKYELYHFFEIRIYPKSFYSKLMDRQLKGGATPSGVLMLSWADFLHGYADEDDRYNLGLHEAAHALRLELSYGKHFDKLFGIRMEEWEKVMKPEFEAMEENRSNFLRDYAATNEEEFFAVSIEHFFEVPDEFSKRLPDLYNHLCILLQQDPIQKQSDYRPTMIIQSMIDEEPKQSSSRFENWHWSLTVLLAGIFVSPFLIFFLAKNVIAGADILLMYYFASVILSFILFHKLVRSEHRILGRVQYSSFCFMGSGPFIFCAMLVVNMYIPMKSDTVEDYTIKTIIRDDGIVFLQDNAYFDKTNYRRLQRPVSEEFGPGDIYRIHFRNGIFGLKSFRYGELIDKVK